ncbi:hypothetical protein AAHH87_00615 [Candidatus Hodgkinia cicadicola]
MVAIEFEPLARGLGIAIANTLRRALLTCVYGWALIGVCIDCVASELDKLEGVREDVVGIVFNMKQLVFAGASDARMVKAVVARSSGGDVLGSHIVMPPGMRVVNSDQRICYVNSGSSFRAELIVVYDVGYLAANKLCAVLKTRSKGYFITDASFCPVKRVSFNVTEPEYNLVPCDKVNMLVESNGAVNIGDVIRHVSKLICSHFADLCDSV